MANFGPIGFFDSGVGGLTIWNEVVQLMPKESTIYIADSENAPYGSKSTDEIIALSIDRSQKLIDRGAKIIVVACNTATTQAIDVLREKFDIPFIGIEPAVKPAALKSQTKSISVLATHGTIESSHFIKTKDAYSDDVHVQTQVGEGLVRLIEDGLLDSKEMTDLLSSHLNQLILPETDYLVLGCTHYPLLIPQIKRIIPETISIVDSGRAVALQTQRVMQENELETDSKEMPSHQLFSTGDFPVLKQVTGLFDIPKSEISYSSLYQSE